MPKLEIPDIPENLFQQIVESARRKGVSPAQQAADILARGIADDAAEARLMAEARKDRESLAVFVTETELGAAKRQGAS
jgi:hypothetical protein